MELLPPPGALAWFSPDVLLATWFGAGLVEPLRAGLAVASVLTVILVARPGRTASASWAMLLSIAAALAIASLEVRSGIGDDRRIVVDEVLGVLVLVALIATWRRIAITAVAALFLFVDRWKPWPLNVIETIPSPFGVLADDMAAGAIVGSAALLIWLAWPKATLAYRGATCGRTMKNGSALMADTSRSTKNGPKP
ncbi:phosphatidylglycerophosphatase A [Aureimonas mangrovi]|uniref:phosphatidylglycerophosphatase A n=1 Tax=Aureimonas mangrovi TaxID=2758041 RepID=UPI00163D7DB0|nr:phosphatidylglycerophosphatase A [Aureimonas mangrovi]